MEAVLWIAAALLAACCATVGAGQAIHLLQLESYQIDGYWRALRRQKGGALWMGADFALGMLGVELIVLLAYTLLVVFAPMALAPGDRAIAASPYMIADGKTAAAPLIGATVALCQSAVVFFIHRRRGKMKQKKPLVVTARVKRLLAVLFGVNALLVAPICLAGVVFPLITCLLPILQTLLVPLAALIAAPMERRINRGFFRDARRILAERDDLIKIGITGSYGKTSTKFILAAILSEKYRVLATPSSYNTPMGVTRVVREQLTPEHQVFIAEMGARHVGDIAELCELVRPTIGVLTSIGPQHLETFHTLDNVAATKFELIDALPAGGAAFFAEQVAANFPERAGERDDLSVAVAGRGEGCGARASQVEVGPEGSTFTLLFTGGEPLRLRTRLLGAHNIDNIALCCAVARHLGLSDAQIVRGVAKAEPIEHRLQLIRGAGGGIVIDDAFNSNPAGAKAALEVLGAFAGRKVIVTPGMVELGEREAEFNRVFGGQIAEAADVAILVGEGRAAPIVEGLLNRGFARENIHIVADLDEAAALLGVIARPGDVTLFENDLPDNYDG